MEKISKEEINKLLESAESYIVSTNNHGICNGTVKDLLDMFANIVYQLSKDIPTPILEYAFITGLKGPLKKENYNLEDELIKSLNQLSELLKNMD